MERKVLETIFANKDSYYFIIQSDNTWYKHGDRITDVKLALIAIPESFQPVIADKDINTITFMESEMLADSYTDNNIYIYPKYPPFQQGQKLLKNATDCMALSGLNLSDLLPKILTSGAKTIWELRSFLSEHLSATSHAQTNFNN